MPYTHYGELGDLWKHLPLCSFLSIEQAAKYIESNAAFPEYRLDRTAERAYGIFNLVEKSSDGLHDLKHTPYLKTLMAAPENSGDLTVYLGSPGLAMQLLGNRVSYMFCDIEAKPLEELAQYAVRHDIRSVETQAVDSIDYLWLAVEKEASSTFLHIDPYRIFEKNDSGRSYFELFVKSTLRGIKTMLWYGYETRQQQRQLHDEMVRIFEAHEADLQKHRVNGVEIEIESIGLDAIAVNPGVPGCGVMIANLSEPSVDALRHTSELLTRAYEEMKYSGGSGRLNRRVTFEN
jgi:23S rRNA (adenine2030-N6)-methyltransferase